MRSRTARRRPASPRRWCRCAHSLGLTVVAEGVDSEAAARSAARDGCDQVAGLPVRAGAVRGAGGALLVASGRASAHRAARSESIGGSAGEPCAQRRRRRSLAPRAEGRGASRRRGFRDRLGPGLGGGCGADAARRRRERHPRPSGSSAGAPRIRSPLRQRRRRGSPPDRAGKGLDPAARNLTRCGRERGEGPARRSRRDERGARLRTW